MKYFLKTAVSLLLIMSFLSVPLSNRGFKVYAAQEKVNVALAAEAVSSSSWDDPEGCWRTAFLTDGLAMHSYPEPIGWRSEKFESVDVNINIIQWKQNMSEC